MDCFFVCRRLSRFFSGLPGTSFCMTKNVNRKFVFSDRSRTDCAQVVRQLASTILSLQMRSICDGKVLCITR